MNVVQYIYICLFSTENQLFGCPVGRCICDMEYVFSHPQSEATVGVLYMTEELIVERVQLNGYITVRSWFKNVSVSCQ